MSKFETLKKEWFSLKEMSYMVNESESTLRLRMKSKKLKGVQRQKNGRYHFHIDEINRYMGGQ
tara:strand:- start:1040 stop:1228 length:189 start_codon:yes stop_codon:yes gene_type:complete